MLGSDESFAMLYHIQLSRDSNSRHKARLITTGQFRLFTPIGSIRYTWPAREFNLCAS